MIIRPLARSIARGIAGGLSARPRPANGASLVLDFCTQFYAVEA